ncbi:MAG: DUF1360 domain-containing protein [Bacteroidetes bacterium]|nr:DUF1360 domain-containing protein [Bacteroidota bacterium]MCW5894239.1 DUF1360 domain-containing protein [Bacteroidota bacterium]
MEFYWFVLAVLSVWRLTHLLQAEDGPWDAVVHLRRVAGNGFFGKLMDCFYCLSIWIAIPFSWWLAGSWSEGVMLWLSLSAGAIILQRVTHKEM